MRQRPVSDVHTDHMAAEGGTKEFSAFLKISYLIPPPRE